MVTFAIHTSSHKTRLTMKTRFQQGTLISFLLVLALGCDSNGDSNEKQNLRPGTFTATTSGHTSTTLSGPAVFSGAGTQWGLVLGLGQAETMTILAAHKDRPEPGTYTIRRHTQVDGPLRAGEFSASLVVGGVSYSGTEGTLTITDSTPNRIRGSLTLKADSFVGQILDVQGTFDASNPSGM